MPLTFNHLCISASNDDLRYTYDEQKTWLNQLPVKSMHVSIIVPAYNCIPALQRCLSALQAQLGSEMEIIVVDDASTDATPAAATQMGVRVIRAPQNGGPGTARNLGADVATGDILLFVDSDVVIGTGMLQRVVETFQQNQNIAALFGSYDDSPAAKSLVSTYRNLLHHYMHQTGDSDADTFWAGFGAIRKRVFLDIGGFNGKRYSRPSIEDIELGYRLKRAGHAILLDPRLQAKHLKEWTLKSVVMTDVFCRAIPWTELILERGQAMTGLNVKFGQRASGALTLLALLLLVLAVVQPLFLWGLAAALLLVFALNARLYVFFWRVRGLVFAATCFPLHLLYLLYSTLSFMYVRARHFLRPSAASPTSTLPPAVE